MKFIGLCKYFSLSNFLAVQTHPKVNVIVIILPHIERRAFNYYRASATQHSSIHMCNIWRCPLLAIIKACVSLTLLLV